MKGDAMAEPMNMKELLGEWRYRSYRSLGPDDLEWLKLWYVLTEDFLGSMPVGYEDIFGHDMWKLYIIMRDGEEAYRRDYGYEEEV